MGPRGDRRRGDRAGDGRRRRGPGVPDAAARGARLRQGDVEPEHEAGARRGALPRTGASSAWCARRSTSAGCSGGTPRTWSTTVPFLVPAYRWWERRSTRSGLKLYDRLAGDLGLGRARGRSVAGGGAGARPDARTERPARGGRLPRRPVRRRPARRRPAADGRSTRAAAALNDMPVDGSAQGTADGSRASRPATPRRARRSRSRRGRWSTRRASSSTRSGGSTTPGDAPMIAPSQGAHLVLDRAFLPGETAVMVPQDRRRPRPVRDPLASTASLVGTTDTPVRRAGDRAAAAATRRSSSCSTTPRRYLSVRPRSCRRAQRLRGPPPLDRRREPRPAPPRLSREHAVAGLGARG